MSLEDNKIDKLVDHIKNSFRVRPNHDPDYVDIGGHLGRLRAKQHQIIFGRRGSGKSCLLVHYHRSVARKDGVLSIYIEADVIKSLPYPDLLIRLLLSISEELYSRSTSLFTRAFGNGAAKLKAIGDTLRTLLDEAEEAKSSDEFSSRSSGSLAASVGGSGSSVSAGSAQEETVRHVTEFRERKIDSLERHLQDYRDALGDALHRSKFTHVAVIVDDFYLISPQWQPNVIDYLHRLVRGLDIYLKVGTVRHRTSHIRYEGGQTIGVELAQDVEEISLDQTFEDIDATEGYLTRMLDSMADQNGLPDFCREHFSEAGLLALTLASGGVPRDFLTIFVEAVDAARDRNATKHLTPRSVYKGAGRVSYRTKLRNLRNDLGSDAGRLESAFRDLYDYCLREKKKTAFLVSQDDARGHPNEHELIQQLMDFKLIHVVEPDTSAASHRQGRYEGYTLDFALFMEPRLRGIDHVEFWKFDEQHRRIGLREAPVYSLNRAAQGPPQAAGATVEQTIEQLQFDVGFDETGPADDDD